MGVKNSNNEKCKPYELVTYFYLSMITSTQRWNVVGLNDPGVKTSPTDTRSAFKDKPTREIELNRTINRGSIWFNT